MKSTRRSRRAARQLFRLCQIDGRLDADRTRGVVTRVVASRRRGALGALADLQRLIRLDRDRHTAVVESATSLDDTLREQIKVDLARAYGGDLTVSFAENPALIGGMRIRVGSDVYDGSIRSRLDALRDRL